MTREFELVTRGFELATCEFELATRGFELVLLNFNSCSQAFNSQLVTRVLPYHIQHLYQKLHLKSLSPVSSVN